jgi:ankyrin repeat protein
MDIIDINTKLFKLLKIHDWDSFTKLLIQTAEIDLNIRDNSQNYLLQYAIIYNKSDVVKLLLEKGCKIDIYDTDGRNILFNPIKYNYVDIIKFLLQFENNNIGISITEMKDNTGYCPIHYAIIFKNMDALKLFQENKKSFNELDNNNNTPLHLAIKSKNINIFNIVLENSNEINFQTLQGESPLHLACNFEQKEMLKKLIDKNANVNIQDFNNEITPLMYSVIFNDNEMFNLLLEKSNVGLQDISGNNIMHYIIHEKNYHFINKVIEKGIDLNISNIHGSLPLHLILSDFENSSSSIDKFNFKYLIENTNLNIQDNEGNSCFLLLCSKKIWKKLIDIIQKKFINYTLKNKEEINALNFIDKDDLDLFYELISKSYLSYIRKKVDFSFNSEFYNICKKELKFKDYNLIKSYINVDIESKLKKTDKDICVDSLKFLLLNNKIIFPQKIKSYCINLEKFKEDINFITYTGTTLDVLFGLIFISNNFTNITTSLTNEFNENVELESYYLNNKNKKVKKEDFINFEIIWDGIKIFYPSNLDYTINKFKSNPKKRYLIIPIGIELENGSHSNILIYDNNDNSLERFEPNGSSFPYKFNYNPKLLDNILRDKFLAIFINCKYKYPKDFLPKIGFQLLETYDHYKTKKIGDPGGFCAVWCVWYVYMKIKYNMLSSNKLVIKLIQKIKQENMPFKSIVRNFAKKIIDIRDEVLIESKLDINIWLNSNYDIPIYNDLILNLQKKIISL